MKAPSERFRHRDDPNRCALVERIENDRGRAIRWRVTIDGKALCERRSKWAAMQEAFSRRYIHPRPIG